MRVVVTGGAGYIGSVTTAWLLDAGHSVCVVDDFSTGHREALDSRADLAEGRVQDRGVLDGALDGADALIHFASLSLVGDSMARPLHYFRENLSSLWSVLDAMASGKVDRLVFSSSAAVYGEPGVELIEESTPTGPVNPYGHTKLMAERVIAEEARARGLGAICLRYFNACGASGRLGEHHDPETHLIPRLCQSLLGARDDFTVLGDDHPTPDGTPVRDYVHVVDLARAHVLALDRIVPGTSVPVNLGTGSGASVREVLAAAAKVTGLPVEPATGPRREGDPARLVASNARAQELLGWSPDASGLEDIVRSAFDWHREHPRGYA